MEGKELRGSFAAQESASPTEADAVSLDLKTKLNILRSALKSERKKTMDLETRVASLTASLLAKDEKLKEMQQDATRLSLLETTLMEKEAKLRELQLENTQMESDLYKERSKVRDMSNSSPVPSNKGKSSFVMEIDTSNQALSEEFHSLKQKTISLDQKIAELTQYVPHRENRELSKAVESRDLHVARVMKEWEAVQEDWTNRKTALEEELRGVNREREELLGEKEGFERKIRGMDLSLAQASDEIAALQAVKTDMQQVLSSLNESLISHAQNEMLLAGKLMALKSELQEATSELKFEALKINKVINREAKLTFKRAKTGEYVLEIDQKARKKEYNVASIEDVAVDPTNSRRFTVTIAVWEM